MTLWGLAKPPGPLRIGLNPPRGLEFCVPFDSLDYVDLVHGLRPTVGSNPYIQDTAMGAALNPNVSGRLGYAMTPPTVFSFEALVIAGSSPGASEGILTWDQNASGTSGTFDRDISGSGGKYSFHIFDGAGKTVTESGSNYAANTVTHLVATSDGTDIKIYVNGALAGTTAAGTAYTGYSSPSYLVFGYNANVGVEWSGFISLFNMALVAWTADEVFARFVDPYGFLVSNTTDVFDTMVGTASAPATTSHGGLLLLGVG